MTKHVLMVVTSHAELGNTGRKTGYFLSELTHPYKVFRAAGYRITIASPRGGRAPLDERSLDLSDAVNAWFMDSREDRAKVEQTVPLSEILARDVDAIYFAGGHGTMWDFPENRDVLRLVQRIWEHGGVVSAVCHGPAALVNARDTTGQYLVKGRTVTAFTDAEETAVELERVVPFMLQSRLVERGARFRPTDLWQPNVVIDERLVTGQNPASATGVGEAVVRLLEG